MKKNSNPCDNRSAGHDPLGGTRRMGLANDYLKVQFVTAIVLKPAHTLGPSLLRLCCRRTASCGLPYLLGDPDGSSQL